MKRWNAGDSLFWFIFSGLGIAAFAAVVAFAYLALSPRPTSPSLPTSSAVASPILPRPSPTPDLSACERLPDDSSQQYGCYKEAAIAAQDPSICDAPSISGWKPMCLLAVAEVAPNETICAYFQVHYTSFMENCLTNVAIAGRDATRCDTISYESLRNGCYKKIAKATDQPEVCEKISDAKGRDDCIYALATELLDRTSCELIVDAERKASCQRYIDFRRRQ